MYKAYTRKQELVIIIFILLIATVSTYYIYNKFTNERKTEISSGSLEIVYNEKNENKLTMEKVTPLNDSIGISMEVSSFTLTNNLTEELNIKIKVLDDLDTINNDQCTDKLIPKENIKIAIKNNSKEEPKIYNLNDLKENLLLDTKLGPLEEKTYSVRMWINKDTSLTAGSEMHYHGLIDIEKDK